MIDYEMLPSCMMGIVVVSIIRICMNQPGFHGLFFAAPTWRITPLSKCLVKGVNQAIHNKTNPLGDLLTLVSNYLLNGMILEVSRRIILVLLKSLES